MSGITITLRDTRGRDLELTDPYILKEWEGFGPPEMEHITTQGPYQIGETWEDALLQPRIINLGVDIVSDDGFAGMWTLRRALIDHLAAYKAGVYVRLEQPDGKVVETFGRYQGRVEAPRGADSGPSVQRVAFSIRCHNAVLYDPTAELWVPISPPPGDAIWAFPLSFPTSFGTGSAQEETTFQYEGTIRSHPIITIGGPATDVVFRNESTDEKLDLGTYEIGVAEEVEIDCRYRQWSVTSDSAGNIMDELTDDSDLVTFHIAADPEVANGYNTLTVEATGLNEDSEIKLRFNTNYTGV